MGDKAILIKTLVWSVFITLLASGLLFLGGASTNVVAQVAILGFVFNFCFYFIHEQLWYPHMSEYFSFMKGNKNYITGVQHPCCVMLAVLNSLIFWGREDEVPRPGSKGFEDMLDLFDARDNGTNKLIEGCEALGISYDLIFPTLNEISKSLARGCPVGVAIESKDRYGMYHCALVVDVRDDILTVVNLYNDTLSRVTFISHRDLHIPPQRDIHNYAYSFYQTD